MGFLGRRLSPSRLTAQEVDVLSDRYLELRTELLNTLADTTREFVHVAPDGRELNAADRDLLEERLRSGARCLSVLTRERALVEMVAERSPRIDLRPVIHVLRRLQRSIVLANSDDPERRAQVGAIENHKAVVRTVLTDLGIKGL